MKKLFSICLVSLLLITCGNNGTVVQSHTFPADGWPASEVITFDLVDIPSGKVPHLRITHTADYGYENLYINLKIDEETKLISVPLMDDMGLWKGAKSDDLYSFDYAISYESSDKSMTWHIEQYSRDPILAEIKSIQLILKP